MSRASYGVSKPIPGDGISASAPVGAVGLTLGFRGAMPPRMWMLTVEVASNGGDVYLYGQMKSPTESDDTNVRVSGVWGVHNDKHGRIVEGKIGTGLAINTSHHYQLENLGAYVGIALVAPAGVTAYLTEIIESQRASG